jgi:hypothetical protein
MINIENKPCIGKRNSTKVTKFPAGNYLDFLGTKPANTPSLMLVAISLTQQTRRQHVQPKSNGAQADNDLHVTAQPSQTIKHLRFANAAKLDAQHL